MSRPLLAILALVLSLGCQPSAEGLVADFNANRAKYDALAAMVAEDTRAPIPPERQTQYRALLDELGLDQLSGGAHAGEINVTYKKRGLGTRGCTPGLAHLAEGDTPSPVVDSIDDPDPNRPTVYQHIDDGWYLFCHRK